MRLSLCSALAGASLLASDVFAWKPATTVQTDKLAAQGLVNLAKYEAKQYPHATCNTGHAYVRKEWHVLSPKEKKAYINAVLCLQSLPSKSGSFAPGAKSRFDDFVSMHCGRRPSNEALTHLSAGCCAH
jgi:tyrosinase